MHLSKAKDMERLRRMALASQGLIGSAPFGRGLSGAVKAIEHLGYIQLDSISVIERAHNHTWSSRVPGFNPDMSNELLEAGKIYEYWAHAASYLPMKDFRYSLPDKKSVRDGVLRHQVPQWLSMPPLSALVLQITQAHVSHGGGGAYYVYLRRNR